MIELSDIFGAWQPLVIIHFQSMEKNSMNISSEQLFVFHDVKCEVKKSSVNLIHFHNVFKLLYFNALILT